MTRILAYLIVPIGFAVTAGVATHVALSAAAAPPRYDTTALCVLAGMGAANAPGQEKLLYWGTDLGISYRRGNRLEMLFGDTWASANELLPDPNVPRDDSYGAIDLARFPDGDAIEAHCGGAPSQTPIVFGAKSDSEFATLDPGVAMDGLKTPVAAFSTSTRPDADEYAIFVTGKPQACASDGECGGFACDPGLGYRGKPPDDTGPGLTVPCIDGTPDCVAETKAAPPPTGLCRDPESSANRPDGEKGRVASVAMRHLVGRRVQAGVRDRYETAEWLTNRFINAAATTVNGIDPKRPASNDYTTPDGATPDDDAVLVWGRPFWNAVQKRGENLHLYLMMAPMPRPGPEGGIGWLPLYFAGINEDGTPGFSSAPRDAVPLDLSGGKGDPTEAYDLPAQMSVRWVPQLRKWVMLYGGGIQLSSFFCNGDPQRCKDLRLDGAAVRIRTADHPWGPWSLPADLVAGGDPREGALAGTQYASGGILHHPDCEGETCAPHQGPLPPDEFGSMYGVNLIEQWTEMREDGAVDLYWNVSTWDPYRVMLMRTRIAR